MEGFSTKELSEALSDPSHPRHKAARMAAVHKKGFEAPKVSEAKTKALKKKQMGQEAKKYEYEANPEMHAFKNSMRRKGFGPGKIFSGALRQAERYDKKHDR